MRFILATLLVLLFLFEAHSAPVVRGIAPNSAAPGETLIVRVVAENVSSLLSKSDTSFGSGIKIRSIVKQSFQIRNERRMSFLQLNIAVNASVAPGSRIVNVAGSLH